VKQTGNDNASGTAGTAIHVQQVNLVPIRAFVLIYVCMYLVVDISSEEQTDKRTATDLE